MPTSKQNCGVFAKNQIQLPERRADKLRRRLGRREGRKNWGARVAAVFSPGTGGAPPQCSAGQANQVLSTRSLQRMGYRKIDEQENGGVAG